MKIGIFFGGQSREREVSFAGGRTVYDNLNKGLFEPVPLFVDSLGNFIYLDWSYIYKGTIRDFYPPVKHLPSTENGFQVYVESLGKLSEEEVAAMTKEVGRQVFPHQFAQLFDFAFLALHGPYGEDGNIQGLLEWHGIPYSGSGILPSAIGIDKALQRDLLRNFGFPSPKSSTTNRARWQQADKSLLFSQLQEELGLPLVIKAAHQGSSIGVNILYEADEKAFIGAVEKALFIEEIKGEDWQKHSQQEKVKLLMELVDIRQGIGMPLVVYLPEGNKTIYHPEELLKELDAFFAEKPNESLSMSAVDGEDTVVFESFIAGKEFSCIVVQDADSQPIALPPTEIVKRNSDMFDYRSKYLPGMTRKVTPIAIASEEIRHIQAECCRMFGLLHFNVYARIDGFITESGEVFLNDPNTTSGMMPSSFFFHQAAEIGLNPSQFLTYLIRTSLAERIKSGKKSHHLAAMLSDLDGRIASLQAQQAEKIKVAVILGGYSSERHISVESGRNIYEKLASSEKYEPIPVFLTGNESQHEMYIIPTNILLKDNADDIKEKARQSLSGEKHEVIAEVIERASSITGKYAKNAIFKAIPIDYEALAHQVEAVFIALHGRPGEDGAVQEQLDKVGLPYNGSNVKSSRITIDKYITNELLKENGISVAKHTLLHKKDWLVDQAKAVQQVEQEFGFPIIAKPADDGCSSAVKKINNAEELKAFAELMFREQEDLLPVPAQKLKLSINEEFPQKSYILIEELIDRAGADHFLEVTGGMLTKMTAQGLDYEVFEPSEALASGEILSLEEKFLAGEGQNITPARFAKDSALRDKIAEQVRDTLGKAARVLGIEGYTRIDAFVRIYGDKAETIIIEANSLPGMTPATCIFHQSAINGYTPLAFIDQILSYGMARQKGGNLMKS